MTGLCVEGHAHLAQTKRDLDVIAMRLRNDLFFVEMDMVQRGSELTTGGLGTSDFYEPSESSSVPKPL